MLFEGIEEEVEKVVLDAEIFLVEAVRVLKQLQSEVL